MNIAFIPARCGSKSIKLKNIKIFYNKPLIFWNLQALDDSTLIDEIVVATDCKKIKKTVEEFKFQKVRVYDRDKKNSKDNSSTESVVLEFLQKHKYNNNDKILIVQATSPLTEKKDFEEALIKMEKEKADSLLTCVRLKRFLWNENNTPINYDLAKRPRRQDFKGFLIENGAFYISKVLNINSSKNRLSGKVSIYEMEDYKYIEIDEQDDWLIGESLMKKYKEHSNNKIRLFLSDVDGTLTDSGMYYSEKGDELKKFNTKDGMGFEMLKSKGIKTGLITSENTKINKKRSEKLSLDFLVQNTKGVGKLNEVLKICNTLKISINEVAYIGDDINCLNLLQEVGHKACPNDAATLIKSIEGINIMSKKGGKGCVREFIDQLIS
jgi:N-acylneuraminate cytidylyltransferase